MKILPPNTFTKRQALFVVGGKKAKKKIEQSDKEIWTVDEINELRGLKLNGTDTTTGIGGYRRNLHENHSGLAEDDKIHSYDNNFDEWR